MLIGDICTSYLILFTVYSTCGVLYELHAALKILNGLLWNFIFRVQGLECINICIITALRLCCVNTLRKNNFCFLFAKILLNSSAK